MADNLWAGAVRKGLAANKPTVPDASSDTLQFYGESDTGKLHVGFAGNAGWRCVGGQFGYQAAPAAYTADQTLTAAELLGRLVTATKATAIAFTLPTGALMDAALFGGTAVAGDSFDWEVINLGSSSGAMTLNAGTNHTIVGNAVVAISTTGRFRTRKTAANTFVTYRVG